MIKNIFIKATKQTIQPDPIISYEKVDSGIKDEFDKPIFTTKEVSEVQPAYEAHKIGALEYKKAAGVGKAGAKDIIHIVSSDPAEIEELKKSADYLGDSLTAIAITDYDTFLDIAEVAIKETVDDETVIKRIKATEWVSLGKPPAYHMGVCHEYLGVPCETDSINITAAVATVLDEVKIEAEKKIAEKTIDITARS